MSVTAKRNGPALTNAQRQARWRANHPKRLPRLLATLEGEHVAFNVAKRAIDKYCDARVEFLFGVVQIGRQRAQLRGKAKVDFDLRVGIGDSGPRWERLARLSDEDLLSIVKVWRSGSGILGDMERLVRMDPAVRADVLARMGAAS